MIAFALFFIAGFFLPAIPYAPVLTLLLHACGVFNRRAKWRHHFQNNALITVRIIAANCMFFAIVNTALMALANLARHFV